MALRTGSPLPSLDGVEQWINRRPELPGGRSPVFVHFWALSCPACKVNMPALHLLRDEFEQAGGFHQYRRPPCLSARQPSSLPRHLSHSRREAAVPAVPAAVPAYWHVTDPSFRWSLSD